MVIKHTIHSFIVIALMSIVTITSSSSMCYTSFFPSIPTLLNNSGLISENFTYNEEMRIRLQDYVNLSIQGR